MGLALKIVLQNDGYFVNIIQLYLNDVPRDNFTCLLCISLCFARLGNIHCTCY